MKIKIQDNNEIRLGARPSDNIKLSAGDVISTGSNDYNDLTNKPSIEGVELIGDVSFDELGIGGFVFFAEYDVNTYQEIDDAYHNGDYIVAFIEDSVNTIGFFELYKYDPNEATYTFKRRNGAVTYTLTVDNNDTWSASYGTMDTGDLSNRAGFIKSPNVVYCTCDTAAGTAAKVATIVSGTLTELHAGDQAIVKFVNTNTASNPTLNIAGTGAKAIKRYGTTAVGTTQATSWTAGTTFICVYDGANWSLVSWINTAYSEISVANITNGTSSSTGLISGRRAKSAVEEFAPVKDVEVNGESVVDEGIAEISIPPLVTDLGYIDPEPYEEDVYVFFNTLTESGFYKFTFGGDDLTYFVAVQSFYLEGSDITLVNQHFWGDEEGPITEYIRAIVLENDEVVDEQTTSYMTMDGAVNAFASKSHVHYRTATAALSVWDYCDGSQITLTTDSPILYTDTRTPRHAWLIETTTTVTSPNRRFIKLTDLEDASIFYQRSGTYSNGVITWDDWYKFTGTVFTP